jgi:lipid A 3-O-deacylase
LLRRLLLITLILLGCRGALAADLIPLSSVQEQRRIAQETASVAPESGRITVLLENDALAPSPTDRWYTQGFQLSYLSGPIAGPSFDWLFPTTFTNPAGPRTRRFEIVVGQSIFTPENTRLNPPDPLDRPYAGWLYSGIGWYQESNHSSLDHLELLVGIVGPAALAKEVQGGFHDLLGQKTSTAWAFQLKNEPGVVLSYDHKWRFDIPLGAGLSIDAIPEFGASVGNVFTYGEVGMMVRFGHNLNADYGPTRIRPALSGTTWFDRSQLDGAVGWYLFAGTQGRAVARNIFLDGNTFTTSPSVDKRTFVGDLSAGVSVFWLDFAKLDLVLTWRSEEFVGQRQPERFGGINLSFRLP